MTQLKWPCRVLIYDPKLLRIWSFLYKYTSSPQLLFVPRLLYKLTTGFNFSGNAVSRLRWRRRSAPERSEGASRRRRAAQDPLHRLQVGTGDARAFAVKMSFNTYYLCWAVVVASSSFIFNYRSQFQIFLECSYPFFQFTQADSLRPDGSWDFFCY